LGTLTGREDAELPRGGVPSTGINLTRENACSLPLRLLRLLEHELPNGQLTGSTARVMQQESKTLHLHKEKYSGLVEGARSLSMVSQTLTGKTRSH